MFLVACYATLHVTMSVRRSVGGQFAFLAFFAILLLLPTSTRLGELCIRPCFYSFFIILYEKCASDRTTLSLALVFGYKEYRIPKSPLRTLRQWEPYSGNCSISISFKLSPDVPSSLLRPFKLPLRHFWMPPKALMATSETLPGLLEAL